jgi:ADP-ribosyl-[dinitrogen reductase] hydrolase
MAALSVADRCRGALFGLAVGDALGAPVEFLSAHQIAVKHTRVREMMAGGLWQKGEWTDDTALTLATAQAYAGDVFDPEAAAHAMVHWALSKPKDIGNLTARALRFIIDGKATSLTAGKRALKQTPGAAGNGSLMRALPTALVRKPDDQRLIEESRILSAITHADERCLTACVAFSAALAELIHHGSDVAVAIETARRLAAGNNSEVDKLLDNVSKGLKPKLGAEGIGYVLVCLERALISLREAPTFAKGVLDVVNLGGDTDTNAAVSGALLGAHFGPSEIPASWLADLQGKAELEKTLTWLVKPRP